MQKSKFKIKYQKYNSKFQGFIGPDQAIAQISPESQLASVLEFEQLNKDQLIFKLDDGHKIMQKAMPPMHGDEIVIDRLELIDQNEPLKFQLDYEWVIPILDDKSGDDIVFVKPGDQGKRSDNRYIPSWAFGITNDSFALDANKQKWPKEARISGSLINGVRRGYCVTAGTSSIDYREVVLRGATILRGGVIFR